MMEKVMYVRLAEGCRAWKAWITEEGKIAIVYKEDVITSEKTMVVSLPEGARAWKAWIEDNGEIAISYKKISKPSIEQ